MSTELSPLHGYLAALGATALWSGNFIVARGLSDVVPPVSLAFWRWVVAVVAILPFAIKPLSADKHTLRSHLPYLCLTALLGVTIFNPLVYIAGHTTSALNLSLIAITFPVFIIILSRVLYGELITQTKVAGVLLVSGGVILLITRGNLAMLRSLSFTVGDLWMLAASLVFALYSILVKQKPRNISIWSFQFSTFLLGLAFLTPFFLWETAHVQPVIYNTATALSILYVGIFASLTAFLFWNQAIVHIGPAKAGLIYYTLPIFSGLLAYFFLNEDIGLIHLLSALLIVTGIVIANRR